MNTTSAGVERTAAAFEEWLQCEYPELKVLVTPVTSCWGNVTVSGPKAWMTLAAIGLDERFAPAAMQHLTVADGEFDGSPVRILRASFTGELFERIWATTALLGGSPYGIEALEILRTEKGYLHVGVDTDGTTLPGDVGFARAPVALAMLARGAERLGESVGVHHLGQRIDAVVVATPFVDPEGKRLHG